MKKRREATQPQRGGSREREPEGEVSRGDTPENITLKEQLSPRKKVSPNVKQKLLPTKKFSAYEEISREILRTRDLKRMLRDIGGVRRDEEERDHLQDVALLSFQLMEKYQFSEEKVVSPRFMALLRRAYERDLIDQLDRKCRTEVWDLGTRKKINSKLVSLREFDHEHQHEDANEIDGRVTLPAGVPDPESDYWLRMIVGKMREVFSEEWGPVADLLANEGLAEHDPTTLPKYRSTYGAFDRISAKAVCDAHGLGERGRKNLLRRLRTFVEVETAPLDRSDPDKSPSREEV